MFTSVNKTKYVLRRYNNMMYHKHKYEEIINEAKKNGGDLVIPDWVTRVTQKMFAYEKNIISVTVPKTVTEIEDLAFYRCDKLETIFVHEGVKLGKYAFSFVKNLRKIIMVHENGTRTIKKWVITRDDLVPSPDGSIVIPEGVTDINERTFSDCTSLKSIVIPSSVTYIWDEVFSGCTSLKSIVIPSSVTYIGDGIFSGCTSLKSVDIPESVTQIGEYAFSGCTSLKSVDIPSGTKIRFNALYNTSISIVQMTEAMLKSFDTQCSECGKRINTKKDRCLKITWSRDGQHRITYACSTCGEELSTRDINNPCAFCDGYDCCSCTVNYEDGMASPDTVESMEWIDN